MSNITKNKIYIDENLYYTIFRIKNRIVFSPCDELKKEQRNFLNIIRWNYRLKPSILKTAQKHVGKKWILKMDIKDFYSSVPSSDIKIAVNYICQQANFSNINYYLNLVTLYDKLPTGAPTSAHIADMCFKPIDKEIRNYCSVFDIDYSRYADDLTFSSDNKTLLNLVEKRVSQTLQWYGYQANTKKTKYICENKQQNILGLVVNKGYTRIPKELQRKVRSMLHNYALFKSYASLNNYVDEAQLLGYLSYIKQVDKQRYSQLKIYAKKLAEKHCIEFPFLKIKLINN